MLAAARKGRTLRSPPREYGPLDQMSPGTTSPMYLEPEGRSCGNASPDMPMSDCSVFGFLSAVPPTPGLVSSPIWKTSATPLLYVVIRLPPLLVALHDSPVLHEHHVVDAPAWPRLGRDPSEVPQAHHYLSIVRRRLRALEER